MRTICLLAFSLLALSACDTTPIAPENVAHIKTIGIISAIGDEFSIQHQGVTVLSDNSSTGSIPEWNLDEFAREAAGELLAQRYAVLKVNYDPSPFIQEAADRRGTNRVGEIVRGTANGNGPDAYLVLQAVWQRNPVNPTGRGDFRGVGLYSHSTIIGTQVVSIYADYYVSVVDGRTFQVVAESPAVVERDDLMIKERSPPAKRVEGSWWADTIDALTVQQKAQLSDAYRQVIRQSLPVTLRDMKLIP